MGHRIELGEIESNAAKCNGVGRACCVYNDEKKEIVLFFAGTVSEQDLAAFMTTVVPRYMLPARIERLDALPQTDNGKINRVELKNRAKNS